MSSIQTVLVGKSLHAYNKSAPKTQGGSPVVRRVSQQSRERIAAAPDNRPQSSRWSLNDPQSVPIIIGSSRIKTINVLIVS